MVCLWCRARSGPRGNRSATQALNSAAESQAAWREVEAGRGQRLTDRMVGAEHGLAVGLLDGDPPERPRRTASAMAAAAPASVSGS